MEESISALKGELYQNENEKIMTRLDIAFMTSSAYDYKQLQPAALPMLPSAIDVWTFRGQEILLTRDWASEDQVVNMNFSGFETQIKTVFSQIVKPTVQPFNQDLVIIDQKLQFLKMESSLVFEVNATSLSFNNILSNYCPGD